MPLVSRLLFTFAAVVTALGAHLADFSDTHLFNPAWTGHAKYHTGHTMALALILGLLTVYFAWRRNGDRISNSIAATGFASAYWLSQLLAILYPNTLFFDPEYDLPSSYLLGLPAQAAFQIIFLSIAAMAGGLALRSAASKSRAR